MIGMLCMVEESRREAVLISILVNPEIQLRPQLVRYVWLCRKIRIFESIFEDEGS